MASFSRGDQSSNPFLHPSLMAEMSDPVICDILFGSGIAEVIDRSSALLSIHWPTILLAYTTFVYFHPLDEKCHPLHGLGTKRSMESSDLKPSLNIAIEISRDWLPQQFAAFCLFHALQSSSQPKNSEQAIMAVTK